jgi:potassium efflux system protein
VRGIRSVLLIFVGACLAVCAVAASGPILPGPARAAEAVPAVSDWQEAVGAAKAYAATENHTEFGTGFHLERLQSIRGQAEESRDAARAHLAEIERLMALLGPAPEPGAPAEPAVTASRRAAYAAEIARARAALAESEQMIDAADAAESALVVAARRSLVQSLLQRGPVPASPEVIVVALSQGIPVADRLLRVPFEWYRGLRPDERGWSALARFLLGGLAVVVGAWVSRLFILRRFGRDPAIVEPTYARALVAAIVDAVARGVVPGALILGAIVWLDRLDVVVSGAFEAVVDAALLAALLFVAAGAGARAILSPDHPQWRVVELAPANARIIARTIVVGAAAFSVELFVRGVSRAAEMPVEFESVTLAAAMAVQASAILLLCRPHLWLDESADQKQASTAVRRRFWAYVRRVLALGAGAAVLAVVFGYGVLARFLVDRLMFSLAVLAAIYLIRGVLREAIGVAVRSDTARRRLGFSVETLRRIRFWARVALDLVLVFAGVVIILPFWGVPQEELTRWALALLRGVTIGNVTIAPVDIALSVAAFIATMAGTRMLQRKLGENVLPHTTLSVSVRHSVTAGIGYVGVIVAGALAIAVLGVDLTNIALVAGALSVGIGFGLQNIVNNFVSGLILLAERPIKVGDWVVVGDKEGFVRRINFRGTELETFQRASVIIPNADILSNPLTNWTHKDSTGRIDVAVGVAYGSDTARVREILLEVASSHDGVLQHPAPFVLFRDFGASSLDFELRCFAGDVLRRMHIASDLRFEIDRRFREEGVEIPFPQRVVHFAARPDDADGAPRRDNVADGLPGTASPREHGPVNLS